MAFPALLAARLAGAGLAGGWIGSMLSGGKKGDASTKTTTTYHPYAFYQPTVSKQIQYPSYQFIIDSPMSSQKASKKQEATQTPSIQAPITPSAAGVEAPVTGGAELMPYVLVGGAVVLGYALISKPKRRRR